MEKSQQTHKSVMFKKQKLKDEEGNVSSSQSHQRQAQPWQHQDSVAKNQVLFPT